MYIEQFLKNDAFFIFSNNFVTPILNLVIEVQRPLFPSNDNIILKTLKVGKTITILETGTRCTNAVIFSELFHFSNKERRLNQGKILLEILLKICAWVYWLQKYCLNPYMYKMDPWGLKNYIFGNHFYSKNARKLRFHGFLHFNDKKTYDIIILPEVDRIHKKLWMCSNLIWVPGDPQLEQNSQFLVNSVHFR